MIDTRQFKLEGLTLQQLRYFNSVAEGDTFADAAAIIGISQSALSQGIARLEQVVGARLLERDGRRRRLTNAGELVAGYARRVLGESEVLVNVFAGSERSRVRSDPSKLTSTTRHWPRLTQTKTTSISRSSSTTVICTGTSTRLPTVGRVPPEHFGSG